MKDQPKILIFYATDNERDGIITPALIKAGLTGRTDVWVSRLGVGKVNATVNSTCVLYGLKLHDELTEAKNIKNIKCINVGVVGGSVEANNNHKVGFVNKVYNNDFDTSVVDGLPFEKPFIDLNKLEGIPCFTQDHFVTDASDVEVSVGVQFEGEFYVDMELYALAVVCHRFGFNLTSIKAISDVVGNGDQLEQYVGDGFKKACELASEKLYELLLSLNIEE